MARPKKITWKVVFDDFKLQFPKLSKDALGFESYDYATIKIKFVDGSYRLYNYDTKRLSKL